MVPIVDVSTAVHAFASILGSLFWRERNGGGTGQHIDMSMLDVIVSMLSIVGTRYLMTGDVPTRQGTENPSGCRRPRSSAPTGATCRRCPTSGSGRASARSSGTPSGRRTRGSPRRRAGGPCRAELYPILREASHQETAQGRMATGLLTEINVACCRSTTSKEVFDRPAGEAPRHSWGTRGRPASGARAWPCRSSSRGRRRPDHRPARARRAHLSALQRLRPDRGRDQAAARPRARYERRRRKESGA